jgi:hypothetical protein
MKEVVCFLNEKSFEVIGYVNDSGTFVFKEENFNMALPKIENARKSMPPEFKFLNYKMIPGGKINVILSVKKTENTIYKWN